MKSWLRMWPPNGGLARQVRQSAMIGERARADDRVMAPVIALMSHPCAQARGDDRAGDPGGELLEAREHRVAVDDERQALDDAGVGVRLHRRRQAHDRVARHHAIGVEHDHMRVMAAPMGDEIGDVAGLAAQVLAPSPVIEARLRQPRAHRQKRALLGDPDVGVGGVGDEEEVERMGLAGAFDVLEDGLHGAEHARGRLVVDRHHDRRSLAQGRGGSRRPRCARSQTKPTMLDVNESVIQENVMTNRTAITHSSGVTGPIETTLNI